MKAVERFEEWFADFAEQGTYYPYPRSVEMLRGAFLQGYKDGLARAKDISEAAKVGGSMYPEKAAHNDCSRAISEYIEDEIDEVNP